MTVRTGTQADRRRRGERALTLAAALVLDRAFGEPPLGLHPVVGIGNLVAILERRAPMGSGALQFAYGCGLVAVTVGTTVGLGALTERLAGRLPLGPRLLTQGALLKPSFAVRELLAVGERVREPLERGDLVAARIALRSLVSRDPSALDASLIAAAAVESLAENASDSIVAPCLAYLVAGLPAAYGYRAGNTLDAMIGYRGRYEHLGKCAARLDDLLNLVPARLTAALIVLGAPLGGGDARSALAAVSRDHHKTASPNAGWPMSAMAGALGVQLEKVGHYRLGDPHRVARAADIATAGRVVARLVELGLLALVTVGSVGVVARRLRGWA